MGRSDGAKSLACGSIQCRRAVGSCTGFTCLRLLTVYASELLRLAQTWSILVTPLTFVDFDDYQRRWNLLDKR